MYNICLYIIIYIHAEKCIASVQSRTRTENKKTGGVEQNDHTCFRRQCCSLNMVLNVFLMPEHAPCEHVGCRLGMVEAPMLGEKRRK